MDRDYVCQYCGKEFVTNHRFRRHIKNVHSQNIDPCDICGHISTGLDSLAFHHMQKHGSIPVNLPQDTTFFKCDKCPSVFRGERQLKRHVAIVHGPGEETICTKCGTAYKGIHRCYGSTFKCSYCDQSYTSNALLHEHELTVHKQEWKHECKQCGKKFGTYQFLKLHTKKDHQIILPSKANPLLKLLTCNLCNRKSNSKMSLSFHYKSVHGFVPEGIEEYPTFQCPHCSIFFNNLKAMQKHVENIHDNPPMFCNKCQVTYRKEHHCRKKEKTFQCSHCEKKWRGKSTLLEHVKTKHELVFDFQCLLCGTKYGTHFGLTRHISQKHKLNKDDQVKDIHFKEL